MRIRLPMMMFGSYASYETKWVDGQKKRTKKTITHLKERGDRGFFPSVNHIYMNTNKGGKRLTKPAEAMLGTWRSIFAERCQAEQWQTTQKEKVVVECTFFFPDKKIRDTSNMFKLLMDSMEGIVFDNDYYALPRVMDFQILKEKETAPYVELEIRKLESEGRERAERRRKKETDGTSPKTD